MAYKPTQFDKEYAFIQLNDILKQGYSSIKSMPAWLRNEYRELSLEKAVTIVNEWIEENKINHEKLFIVNIKHTDYILTRSEYMMYTSLLEELRSKRSVQ